MSCLTAPCSDHHPIVVLGSGDGGALAPRDPRGGHAAIGLYNWGKRIPLLSETS